MCPAHYPLKLEARLRLRDSQTHGPNQDIKLTSSTNHRPPRQGPSQIPSTHNGRRLQDDESVTQCHSNQSPKPISNLPMITLWSLSCALSGKYRSMNACNTFRKMHIDSVGA